MKSFHSFSVRCAHVNTLLPITDFNSALITTWWWKYRKTEMHWKPKKKKNYLNDRQQQLIPVLSVPYTQTNIIMHLTLCMPRSRPGQGKASIRNDVSIIFCQHWYHSAYVCQWRHTVLPSGTDTIDPWCSSGVKYTFCTIYTLPNTEGSLLPYQHTLPHVFGFDQQTTVLSDDAPTTESHHTTTHSRYKDMGIWA